MNTRFRPYRIILPRQGGSINIIQVTVYSFTVPALKLMNVKFCLFLATTAHCHDRAAIKIHITTFNRINLHVRCGNLHNFNCLWSSIYNIYYTDIIYYIDIMYKHYLTYRTDGAKKVRGPSYKVQQYFNLFMQTYIIYIILYNYIVRTAYVEYGHTT